MRGQDIANAVLPGLGYLFSLVITGFICLSTLVFVLVGKPVKVLIAASAIDGLVLPVALLSVLTVAHSKKIIGDYKHLLWMTVFGVCSLNNGCYWRQNFYCGTTQAFQVSFLALRFPYIAPSFPCSISSIMLS